MELRWLDFVGGIGVGLAVMFLVIFGILRTPTPDPLIEQARAKGAVLDEKIYNLARAAAEVDNEVSERVRRDTRNLTEENARLSKLLNDAVTGNCERSAAFEMMMNKCRDACRSDDLLAGWQSPKCDPNSIRSEPK